VVILSNLLKILDKLIYICANGENLSYFLIDYLILGGMDGGPKCGKEVKRRAFAE
jgi:hypothetical protein